MKFIIYTGLFILTSCSNQEKKLENAENVESKCSPYFLYDEIEYYTININQDEVSKILEKKNKSEQEIKVFHLLVRGAVTKFSDTSTLNDLESLNYKKQFLDSSKFSTIDEIFCERKHTESISTACDPFYRDILVFKNKNQIKGIANICFSCGQHIIIGTVKNTIDFGQSGDYKKLSQLLIQ